MNATATKAQKKIALLKALIDHPRTGENERDAARRMLARVIDKAETEAADVTPGWYQDTRVYGAKYDQVRGMGLAQIAKLMREDIKLARKIGKEDGAPGALAVADAIANMPTQIKISVTSEYYSGGGAIRMYVKNIPADWGFVQQEDDFREGVMRAVPSPALAALLVDLRIIHFAYNYDNSDIMTDYFEKNYAGSVGYERPYDRV